MQDDDIRSLLILRLGVESLFFKNFEQNHVLPSGLNTTHMRTLIVMGINGPSTMSQLSKVMLLEKGSFSPVVNRLMELSYIEKIQDKNDKRKFLLHLNDEGRAFSEEFKGYHAAFIKKVLSKLSVDEKNSYLEHMEAINQIHIKLGLQLPCSN